MNINKFTQKSAEALNNCEKLAYEYGNQEVDQEHLLYSVPGKRLSRRPRYRVTSSL